ncbi:hypothetical protein QTJ16_006095 [Diplocarpon rosae]|uniref:Carrier domain-containing protein n=1 Tax=Diplocarpon rosae TaxID=946125 RepID=A0AAD9WB35_9HELO|nr:hypothetical protein QTJ16_006095 [Diplocarpon rosae]
MLLEDSLFTNVDLRRYEKVISPKVIGSINLDRIFQGDSLEFFLFFSSIVCVTGNPGQSLYGAANAFMASLARERRQRGVASSVIQIGAILGTGYISRELSLSHQDYLRSIGHRMMSEQDVLEIVAEGILASHPRTSNYWNPAPRGGSLRFDNFDFATGFNILSNDQDLASLPVLQHLVPRERNSDASSNIKSASGGAIKARLADASTIEAASEVLLGMIHDFTLPSAKPSTLTTCLSRQFADIHTDSLVLKMQSLLRADSSVSMLEKSPDDLGVDSLVAVDLRSWFMGELGVDLPMLKIINAPSVQELGRSALDILPRHLIPKVSESGCKAISSAPVEASAIQEPSPSTSSLAPPSDVTNDTASTASETTTSTPAAVKKGFSDTMPSSSASLSPPESKGGLEMLQRVVPMSFGQSRFWFMRKYIENPTAFNITWMVRCHGLLRVEDFSDAVHRLGQRHESLRTCFVADAHTDKTMQGILVESRFRLEHISVEHEQEAQELAQRMKDHVFDVEHGELVRIQLLSLSSTSHLILLGGHHLNMDGMSWNVLLSDLERAYNGKLNTKPDRSEMLQYPDYSLKEQQDYLSGAWDDKLNFWADRFDRLPDVLPVLPLAGRLVRPKTPQFGFHTVKIRLDKDMVQKALELCRRMKVSPFHFYLAVFHVLLYRLASLSSEPDIKEVCIGVADGNRSEPGVQQTMGVFVNTIPLRLPCKNPKETFRSVLQQVRTVSDSAFGNAVPFDVLIKHLGVPRDASHSPLVQAYINYRQGIPETQTLLGCECVLEEVLSTGLTDHDVSLEILDSAKSESGDAQVAISVQKGLYEPEAAELMLDAYQKLMKDLVANPAAWISRPSLWSQSQVDSAMEAGRGSEIPAVYPSIVHRMDAVVHRCPDRIALHEVGTKRSLTFSAMASRVEAFAQHLSSHSVGLGAFVGVFQSAGSDWVCSLLAILRVGAIYVPMEPKVGFDRLSLIARQTGVSAVLVDDHTVESDFAKALLHPSDVNTNHTSILVINITPLPISPEASTTTTVPSPIYAHSDEFSIVIPTSGSTGAPKCVVFSHSALSALADMLPVQWGLRQDQDTVLHQSSYMFDASIVQTIISLGSGSTIVIVGDEARGDPAALCSIIVKHGIDVAGATPTEYAAWARHWDVNVLRRSSWRVALTWGEPFTRASARDFHHLAKPGLKILDEGGPTEVCMMVEGEITKDAIEAAVSSPDFVFSHFRCTPNKSIAIVDNNLNPLPAGAVGEIVVGGAIAQGYLHRDTETAAKFIDWAHHASPHFHARGWKTAHRTGDLGRMTKDGRVILLGRMVGDTQVKLGGIRVDLKDVEATILQAHSAVSQCVVSARTVRRRDSDNTTTAPAVFLVAFVVLSEAAQVSMTGNHRATYLQRLPRTLPLPQYMRPTMAIEVPQLAISGNGKLDRRTMDEWSLSDYSNSAALEGPSKLALGLEAVEERLLKLWEQVLPPGAAQHYEDTITGETDFFHVGGTSLALINLLKLIRDEFGHSLTLLQLFQASTLTGMAGFLEGNSLVGSGDTGGATPVNWDREVLLPDIRGPLSPDLNLVTNPLPHDLQPAHPPKIVVLTGATGFLGREIIRQLLENTRVEKIYCLAVRKPDILKELSSSAPLCHVIIKRGDLGEPRLGLSADEATAIFAEADAIIHAGADVSFLKSYATLRATNVASTRELLVLAAPRRIPFHFVSTAGVASLAIQIGDISSSGPRNNTSSERARTSFGRESIAPYPPPCTPAANLAGYVPAKWASEVLVERASETWHVPAWIHRPTSIVDTGNSGNANELDLIHNMIAYTAKLGVAPDTRQWTGSMNFVSLGDAARRILRAVMDGACLEGDAEGPQYLFQAGRESITGTQIQEFIQTTLKEEKLDIAVLDFGEWVDRAEAAGMNMGLVVYLRQASQSQLLLPELVLE